jgi:heme exporter protein A
MRLASAPDRALGIPAMMTKQALPARILTVSGLCLNRGGRPLFEGLGFELGPSETLLVRGPNGAGKSSLLLTLAGILRPDMGAIHWLTDEPVLHLLGHQSGIKPRLTLNENLRFWRTVNGPNGIAVEAALDRVGLAGLGPIEANHLSAGQTRRLALARLLVSHRDVWLLDEPTAALDKAGHALVGELVATHAAAGGAALVATHDDIPGLALARSLTLGAR